MSWKLVRDLLVGACRIGAGLAFTVLICSVTIQVLGRSVFADSPVWTEELTRFALLHLTGFGAGLSFRTGDLVHVDIVCEALPGRLPWRLRLVSATATAIFALALVSPALRFMNIGALQTSPTLGVRMNFIHASMVVLLGSLAVFAALRVLGMLTGATDGRPTGGEQHPDTATAELPS